MNAMGAAWAALLTTPGLALAASESGRAEAIVAPGSGMLVQLTLGLAVVLAAAIALSWLLRRYALPRGGAIQVIGGLPLGSRERLLLIEVDQVRLLIGVTSSQIQALHVFPAPPSSPKSAAFKIMPDSPPAEAPHDRPES